MQILLKDLIVAYAAINCVGILVTYIDKKNTRFYIQRVPNWVFLVVGAVGGAAGMLLAMRVLRHKTRYKRFMIGLPIMIVIHALIFVWMRYSTFITILLEEVVE